MIEDEKLFNIKNWITQRNTRGIGAKTNYMSAREDFLFLTKSESYTFNIPTQMKNQLEKIWGLMVSLEQTLIKECQMCGVI